MKVCMVVVFEYNGSIFLINVASGVSSFSLILNFICVS